MLVLCTSLCYNIHVDTIRKKINNGGEKVAQSEEEKKKYQREYHRQWRRDNPDKHKAIMDRFWEKKHMEFVESKNK